MAFVRTETVNNILHVILDRPEKHNAFHPQMIQALKTLFEGLATRADLRGVLLRGEGKSFCSGADLDYMKSMANYSFAENLSDSKSLFEMFKAIRFCPVPVVGQVHGFVMGGGVGLAAACDMVGAVTETQFCFSETRLGLIPAVISPFVLSKVGGSDVRELMLTAKTFDADKAMKMGLVQFVGRDLDVAQWVEQTLKTLNDCGPQAVRATKKLMDQVLNYDIESMKDLTTKAISDVRVSSEGQEGLKSFLEKRSPNWKA